MADGPIASLNLQHSETAVLAAASRLFAAYVAAGRVTEESEPAVMDYCIKAAIRLALRTDRLLQSDDETTGLGRRR